MLDCVNVVKRYGGKFAVNGMSVAIEDAHIYCLYADRRLFLQLYED